MVGEIVGTNPLSAAVGLTLLHFLWEGLLVALVLSILLALAGKGRPRLRYTLSCSAFLLMTAAPLVTLWILASSLPQETTLPAASMEDTIINTAASVPADVVQPVAPAAAARQKAQAIAAGDSAELRAQRLRILLYRAAPWLSLIWGVGVGVMALRLVAGAWGVAVLRRRHIEPADVRWRSELDRLMRQMGIRRPVTVMASHFARVPMLVGWLRPVVLVPVAALTGLPPDQIRPILAHELAHLVRWDRWFNLLQLLVETLLFYHPAVWWISGCIRDAREYCCDDTAVSVCDDALQYAEALAAIAGLRTAAPALALSSGGGSLMLRIQRLLEPSAPVAQDAHRGLAGLGALALAVGFVIVARSALAQEEEIRYVVFPENNSLGQLYIRDAGTPLNVGMVSAGNGEGWRTYVQASGVVEVPAKTELMLRLIPQSTPRLSALDGLSPDDLQKLDMRSCGLKDDDLAHIEGLTGLKSLCLVDNVDLTDAGLEHLKGMTSLVWLSLEKASITCDSAFFDNLPALEYLDVYGTRLSDAGLARISRLSSLKSLGLEEAQVMPEALKLLARLRNLEEANLESTRADDSTLASMASLPSLRFLNAARTDITGAGLGALAEAPALETLDLKFTSVNDAGLQALRPAPRLRRVLTEGTPVTKEGLAALAAVTVNQTVKSVPAQASQNPNAPRVGLLFSHFTATGPHWIAKPYGYNYQFSEAMASMLEEANFDLYAIVEPGTENEGELPDLLAATRLTGKTIDSANAEALAQLNVIFTKSPCNMRDEMTQALLKAVRGGVGLVAMGGVGFTTPGPNAALAELLRINRPEFYFRGAEIPCRVVATHPILGPLKVGDTLTANMLEGYQSIEGSVFGQPLLSLGENSSERFCPMYVSTLGKGRVVCMQWFNPALKDSPFPNRDDLYIRAVNWAANRPADAEW